jgi:glycerate 2-kinase
MARALEEILGRNLTGGLLATNALVGTAPSRLRVVISGHPVPNEGSIESARTALALLREHNTPRTLVFFLITGGGSSLFELPVEPLTLDDLQRINRELVTSGMVISEINAERRKISKVKGGRLAEAAELARQVSLYISDVNSDDLRTVASGPTLPGPGSHHLLVDNAHALNEARAIAESLGLVVDIAHDLVEGDVEEMAREHLARLDAMRARHPHSNVCLISGGEVICPVRGTGQGGRNQEFVLRSLIQMSSQGRPSTVILSAGTDGIDGNSPAAGAIADSSRSRDFSTLDPNIYLANSDSYGYFSSTGEAIITGPTGNNVRDLRMLIGGGM